MTKNKTIWVCQNCGAESVKWLGRCPACGEWNTYHEEVTLLQPRGEAFPGKFNEKRKPELLSSISSYEKPRYKSGIGELDRILGGGLVPGSLVLLGGEPGVGKSTMALHLALATQGRKVLYVSGEESGEQISLRAKRLGKSNPECYVL